MCFSATASFSVAAGLLPVGAYCLSTARRTNPGWLLLAAYPIAFGVQQAIEGALWLGVTFGDQALTASASRGFLFFSHFFWLAWVPLSIYWLETEAWRRKALAVLTAIGALFGLSIFLPAFLKADWLTVELVRHSLEYKTLLIYDGYVDRGLLRMFYAAIVLSALFLSRDRRVQIFGGLIAASLLGTYVFFAHAFISVWCFFAAILSIYIAAVLLSERQQAARTV